MLLAHANECHNQEFKKKNCSTLIWTFFVTKKSDGPKTSYAMLKIYLITGN